MLLSLVGENREARRRSGSLPDSEDMTLQGGLVGELLADESENCAKKHESGANEDNLQSEIHKNSLRFQGRAKCPAKAGLAASRFRHALLGASLTMENVRYTQALIVEMKEIRWKGGAPGSGSMPRISASLGRRRSDHESVLSERVQSG